MLLTLVVFLLVVGSVTAAGMRLYVRPKEAMERVVGSVEATSDVAPSHPSLAIHELIKKLGTIIPQSPKDVTVMQRRLIRAGVRNENALKILYGAKAFFGIALPLLTAGGVMGAQTDSGNKFAAILGAAAAGFFGPNEYVRRLARKRQHEIARGLPNALDLLVVCVESGLGLDQAVLQVSKELDHAHPEISEEFGMVTLELKAGKRRVEALRNLADRTGVEDLKKLVAVLIQADRVGTGVAQSLRAHADFMRIQARQVAEEKAAKLGVKLIFPIFFCILPSLFVVTVGPVAMKIIRELIPMMNNI
jgi:tight adherence protein C